MGKTVIIFGAGPGGLTAGRELVRNGCRIDRCGKGGLAGSRIVRRRADDRSTRPL